MSKSLVLALLVCLVAVAALESCPDICYCGDNSMVCSKVNITDAGLMNLRIPPDVTSLKLSGNGIKRISSEILRNLQHLEELEISKNLIKEIPEGTFQSFHSLKKLILNENEIKEISVHSFIGLVNLRQLELQGNQITDLQPGVFYALKQIHTIRIQNNQVKDIKDRVFSTLPTLRNLFISGNKIAVIGDAAFQHMQMDMLSVATNKISIIPHTAFEGFQITGRVVLLNNPIDCNCKYAMNFINKMKNLENKIWGYCKAPFTNDKDINIFQAHKKLMCSMCDLDPCQNGGECSGDKNDYKCTCSERFKGKNCEINICSALPATPKMVTPDNVALKRVQINNTEYIIVKEQITNKDDEKKLKILYAMCSFEFVVIIAFVVYFMWKRYEEWKLQKQYEHDKSRAIMFSIRNQTNAKLAKALCEENEEFPFDLKNMILKGSVPV